MEKCPFDLTPYKIGASTSKPQVFSLNYTNQDFWSMKTRLINYITENFGSQFNDFVESLARNGQISESLADRVTL